MNRPVEKEARSNGLEQGAIFKSEAQAQSFQCSSVASVAGNLPPIGADLCGPRLARNNSPICNTKAKSCSCNG